MARWWRGLPSKHCVSQTVIHYTVTGSIFHHARGQEEKTDTELTDDLSRIGLYKTAAPGERVLIAISGIPGSGKTTLAQAVSDKVNDIERKNNEDALSGVIPMDGYHYYRSQLAAMPDPATAIHRRGAAFTFDAVRFHHLVTLLRRPGKEQDGAIVYAPSFDHALKDPVEDDIAISPRTRILLFEGLYLSLNREPWDATARLMDELWFVEARREVAHARLVKRHVASGIVEDEAAAEYRIASTDSLNADDILANRLPVQELIYTG